jgi:ATP-binding cassette, subfamily B, bacterial PglK
MNTIKEIIALFTYVDKLKIIKLLALMLIVSVLEMIGVASIMPFIALLSNPEIIDSNSFLNLLFKLSSHLGVQNKNEFLYLSGFVVLGLFMISIVFRAVLAYVQARFLLFLEYNLSIYLISRYLSKPYLWFLGKNSSELQKNLFTEVSLVINQGLSPVLTIFSQLLTVTLLTGLIMFVDPITAVYSFFLIFVFYFFVYKGFSLILTRAASGRFTANKLRFLYVNEIFGAIKEIKIKGVGKYFLDRYKAEALNYVKCQSSASIIGNLPRFFLEGVGFSGILLFLIYKMSDEGGFISSLPIVALYTLAAYKLLPSIQQIYTSFTQLQFISPAVENLSEDLKEDKFVVIDNRTLDEKFSFNHAIRLDKISFKYPGSSEYIFRELSLNIPYGSSIGIVGTTGSGKSTLVNILLGLFELNDGSFLVDNLRVTKSNITQWQNVVGYVPQEIYITDGTFIENIAFGISSSEVSLDKVKSCITLACLDDFIGTLPDGLSTNLGERGVRLSGGQKQRIGIARALYNEPDILIFDEATSALDNITERNILQSIRSNANIKTLIMVAHRLNTIKDCDNILVFENGEVVAQGTYTALVNNHDLFKV